MMRKTKNPIDRFNAKFTPVTETGCWLWEAGVKSNGYGQFTLLGKEERAHRASYKLFIGDIPEGQQVLHKCDNPLCVNPNHLFLGSVQDNMQDKVGKNRHRHGLNHPCTTLSEKDVLTIKSLLGDISQRAIAAMFKVSESTISDIKHGKRYAEVY